MKKIISSKGFLFFNIFGVLFFGATLIYSLYMLVINIFKSRSLLLVYGILSFLTFFLFVIYIIALNRISCIVWSDGRKIGRKGLLFGFKYEIAIQDIQDIVITSIPRQGKYIVILDKNCKSFEGLSKKSFIRLAYSEKNIQFIEQFHTISFKP